MSQAERTSIIDEPSAAKGSARPPNEETRYNDPTSRPFAGLTNLNQQEEDPCQHPDSLDILREFNTIFADRLERIDQSDGPNCIAKKYPIYREWVECLIDQNSDLIGTVEEIEREACNRLRQLEERVRNQTNQSVLDEYRSDHGNLIEFIRRARDDREWNSNGLEFYHVKHSDLLGTKSSGDCERDTYGLHIEKEVPSRSDIVPLLIDPNSSLDLHHFNKILTELKSTNAEQQARMQAMADENRNLRNHCEQLENEQKTRAKRVSEDTRALVLEVAERHDTICKYRNDINKLEEQLEQKDLHIQFKDNIIRDLRRECKKSPCFSTAHASVMTVDRVCESPATDTSVQTDLHTQVSFSCADTPCGDYSKPPHSGGSMTPPVPPHEWTRLQQSLEQKEQALLDREATIAEQSRQLGVLSSMRALVNSFRSVLGQLQGCEYFQPNPTDPISSQNRSISSLDLSGELTSGFHSHDTVCPPNVHAGKPPSDPSATTEYEDTSALMSGIQTVMQNMCTQIVALNRDKAQLNEDIMSLKEDRAVQNDDKDVEAGRLRAALIEVAKTFSRLTNLSEGASLAGDAKRLDAELLDAIANGNIAHIVQLAEQLKSNLQAKDELVEKSSVRIQQLEAEVKQFQRELFETRRRESTILTQEREQHMDTISNLNDAVAVHKESLEKLQVAKSAQEDEIKELHSLISIQHKADQARIEKQLKLENELRDEFLCSDLQLLHDTSDASAVSVLSDQLSAYFDENLQQQLYIQQLLDDNLYLRTQLGPYAQECPATGRSSSSNVYTQIS